MVCGTDGGFLVLVWYVVMMVDVWCLVVCGDDGGFVVMMVGLWLFV